MPSSFVASVFESRSARMRRVALVAIAAFVLAWFFDATVDVWFWPDHRRWVDEIVQPSGHEIWMRLIIAALVAQLFLFRHARARLHVLSAAFDEAPDGIQISDPRGYVVYSNRAVQQIYGFAPEELRGKHVSSMNVDPEFADRVILPAILQTGRWTGELEVKHKDGSSFPIWLTTALIVGGRGKPIAAVGIIRDISERRQSEQELRGYASRLEEATEMKELFADILRHDLLGPAGALRMSIDLLGKRETDPATRRVVEQMRRSCARLIDMIEHAAKYAKLSAMEQVEMRELELRDLLAQAMAEVEPTLQERGARIAVAPGPEVPLQANPLLVEVFSNLLSNAAKYGARGGTVTVDVQDGGEQWVVSIADRGQGIRDQDKQRVFTRFERLQREGVKGTGLGLAIAKRTVEMHGGRIWVEDNPGGGSVFRVALPKAKRGAAASS